MKHEKAPNAPTPPPRFQGVLTISYVPMFWKIKAFGHFGQIRPFPVVKSGQNGQREKLNKTFHMSLFRGQYYHPLQRNSPEKLMFRKHAVFGRFGQIRPFPLAKCGKKCRRVHLQAKTFHMSLLKYSQVSMTIRYKDAAWKEIDDGRTDGRTPRIYRPPTFGVGTLLTCILFVFI